MTTPNNQAPYNWADDLPSRRPEPPQQAAGNNGQQPGRGTRAASAAGAAAGGFLGGMSSGFVPPVNVTVNEAGGGGGRNGGRGNGAAQASGGGRNNHQGDGMISAIERIEFRGAKDIMDCAKAVNRLGRELHFILSMRAEEIQAVLSTHKGTWYTFGASSRVRARLVAMHLKVSAEAAKALGVGALKMAHAFDRHFVKPEQEAKRKKNGQKGRREFNMGDV